MWISFAAIESSANLSETPRFMIKALPTLFIENHKKLNERVRFYASLNGGKVLVNKDGSLIHAFRAANDRKRMDPFVIEESLAGAKVDSILGDETTAFPVNQLQVTAPSQDGHQTNGYGRLDLGRIYDGIRYELTVHSGVVEKVFTIAPGADPHQIQIHLEGVRTMNITSGGELEAGFEGGGVVLSKPIAYQDTPSGRRYVMAEYKTNDTGYGFRLGQYDPKKELIIDPTIRTSFLEGVGEFGGMTEPIAMVADETGNLIIADSYYIRKISPDLSRFIAVASITPPGSWIKDIAFDHTGNVIIAGGTRSAEFPGISSESADRTISTMEGFVAKVDAGLSRILAATYIGGSGRDSVQAIDLDSSGNIFAAGSTDSDDFPGVDSDSADSDRAMLREGFIVKLDPEMSEVLAASYMGSGQTFVSDLCLDDDSNVYLAGTTSGSGDFPGITGEAADSTESRDEGFIAKLDPNLTTITAATYLGGSGGDFLEAIRLDGRGDILAVGITWSSDFPGVDGDSADSDFSDLNKGFVVRLDTDLRRINAATFLGGVCPHSVCISEGIHAVSVDTDNNVYVVGNTDAHDFPGIHPLLSLDGTISGREAFMVKLDPELAEIQEATYLGGSNADFASAVHVSEEDLLYVAGETFSSDFPGLCNWCADDTFHGQEIYVARLDLRSMPGLPDPPSTESARYPRIEEPPRRLDNEALFLIDCGPCPSCFEGPCDPRINPNSDKFLIWHPELDILQSFSRTQIGLREQDGPIASAAPIKIRGDKVLYAITIPYADSDKADVGAVFFLDETGKTVAKVYGSHRGERLGVDMAVRGDEVVVVSTRRVLRFEETKKTFDQPLTRDLMAHQGIHVTFTADMDSDRKADIMLGAPFANAAGIEAAGLIQILGSKTGQLVDTMFGREKGEHLGGSLQQINWDSSEK
jgi:hypothetical protein